jgi:hypothetical protein
VPAPFGFLCKKSMVSLAEVMAAFFSSLIAGARLFLYVPGCWRRTAVRRW